MIKACFVASSAEDFGALENNGLTHVIIDEGIDISSSYSGAKDIINTYETAIETTNLKLIVELGCFYKTNGVFPDPADPVRTTTFATNAATLIQQTGIQGFTTDDYIYPNQPASFVSTDIQNRNKNALISFADALTTAVHDADSQKTVSACTYHADFYNSMILSWFAPCFDYLMPEIYRNPQNWVKGTEISGYAGHQLVKQTLINYLAEIRAVCDTPVVPTYITYQNDASPTPWSMQEISADIGVCSNLDIEGYALYLLRTRDYPSDLSFPNGLIRTPVNRSSVTRQKVNRT